MPNETEEVKDPLQEELPAEPVEDEEEEEEEDLDKETDDEPEEENGQENAANATADAQEVEDDDFWDDWDDDDDEADDVSDASESEPDATAEAPEAEAAPTPEGKPEVPAATDTNAELIDRLLTDLGYEGTAEEKVAKYKSDNGISDPKQDEPVPNEEADLDTRAKRDLETLSKAYPERMKGIKTLKDIPEFDAVVRKIVSTGCSMLEAYNEVVIGKVPSAKAEKQKAQAQSKSHLVGTSTAVRSSRFEPDTSELRELRRNLPDYTEERIRELYRKVQKNTR